ncbi:type II toxin-antitoxin system HigB family toxin [uncultured Cedecea sp.]|uniref:type II toxin-antitoxin system HigB family toxin n=1 Tax=uncultured Cedecea sp. TaxID=988762 RepID=UPI002622A7EF|nr:type II toxin-antitoxin system HigB family toxin [uncultured Cedecea sp.]
MMVLNVGVLTDFIKVHNQAKGPLEAWREQVNREKWKTTHDIRNSFNSADFFPDNKVVFNIKGNNYRLLVTVKYQAGMVIVEKVGTHSEYNKWRLR